MVFDFLIAFLVALGLGIVFVPLLGWRGRGEGAATALVFFFVILLFATWAGGVWIEPFGPTVGEAPWLAFLLVGVAVALLLLALVPPRTGRVYVVRSPEGRVEAREEPLVGFGVFFWIFLLALIAAIVVAYA